MDAPLRLLVLSPPRLHCSSRVRRHGFRSQAVSRPQIDASKPKSSHKPGPLDDLFQHFFRSKLAEEVGWDSQKPGYAGLIEVANHLMMKGRSNSETEQAAVRVLESLFPTFVLVLFKMLIAPIGGGKVASTMVARATALSCQWLVGPCSVNSVELLDGSSCASGVFIERCKYLEESKCVGICINTCKLPTQTFFKDSMGVPLYMEPNFSDYSCQFKFGVAPPGSDKGLTEPCLELKFGVLPPGNDKALNKPCFEIRHTATRCKKFSRNVGSLPESMTHRKKTPIFDHLKQYLYPVLVSYQRHIYHTVIKFYKKKRL